MESTVRPTTEELEKAVESLRRQLAQEERRFRLLDDQMHVLERERQKLAAIVHHADAGFVAFNPDGRVAWTNRHFARGFANDSHPASSLRASCHQVICRNAAPCDGCPLTRALATGTAAHLEVELPVRGEARDIYLTAIPIMTMTGETAEILVMLQDLSSLAIARRAHERAHAPDGEAR